ncbi:MAG: selenoneine synthase SenA [Burkholderiales bacterium]
MDNTPFLAQQMRHANATELAQALADCRARTLALFACYRHALGDGLGVPQTGDLNPPLWELGHIGWFQEFWLTRNPQRSAGTAADPHAPRAPSLLVGADALFNSSTVPHTARWTLQLLNVDATLAYLHATLAQTLDLLACSSSSDDALYFFRLALLHEDMHSEAWVQMAQSLGIAVEQDGCRSAHGSAASAAPAAGHLPEIQLSACTWPLGSPNTGFVFDNELGSHSVALTAFAIDARPVSLAQFLAFVDDGGYRQARYWSAAGWQWLSALAAAHPKHLRRSHNDSTTGWQQERFGQWQAADLHAPATHLTYFEAQAWCQWAGRRLPSETEWECAALTCPQTLQWGQVWEWTASTFMPYPGFAPHPYRDYSAPWFGTHQVLRGASWATSARVKHPRYRNFFEPQRNDVLAGFRTCAG